MAQKINIKMNIGGEISKSKPMAISDVEEPSPTAPALRRRRAGGWRSKWAATASSAWIQTTIGGATCFSLYSPLLKASQGYDQSTLTTVALAKDVGANAGVIAGLIVSCLRSPRLVLLAGAIQSVAGYLLVYLAVVGATPRPPVPLMCVYMFVAAQSQTYFNTANVVTAVENFPDCRGTVLGIMKGFLGLSGAILVQIGRAVFAGEQSSLILMLGLLPAALTLLLIYFIQVHPSGGQQNKPFLDAFSVFTVTVAAYLFLIVIGQKLFTFTSSLQTASLAVLLALLFAYPAALVAGAHRKDNSSEESTMPLLLKEAAPPPPRCNAEDSTEDLNLWQAMCTVNFWLLFFSVACGLGSGLAVMNNVSQIGASQGYKPREVSTLVSLWSIWSFTGRFFVGYATDHFLRAYACPRPLFIGIALLSMSCGHLAIASGFPGGLYVGSTLVGLCHGALWVLNPTVTSEIFGLRHFGAIFNTVTVASPIGSYILSVRVVGYLYDEQSRAQGRSCLGTQCFRLSFAVVAGACLLGLVSAMVLFFRTRKFYKEVVYVKLAALSSR